MSWKRIITFFFFVVFHINLIHSLSLEEVTDAELLKLINQEQYVVVLFSKFWFYRNVSVFFGVLGRFGVFPFLGSILRLWVFVTLLELDWC